MNVPGSNLLAMALTVITPQTIILYSATGRTQNERGSWVTSYAAPVPIEGSWQPVDQSKIQYLGLDTTKRYFNFFTLETIESVNTGESPDLAERNGRKYSTVGDTPWNDIDGWQSAMFIDIGKAD